ncbi:hypothetical protein Bbelb_378630 [Branchiostoma belcheri]|nr:hypothetical protein Bbelb_378630 [Branchiostoma belcheri]
MEMWNEVKSRRVYMFALGCGLLAITLAILASCLIPARKVANESKNGDKMAEIMIKPGTPSWTSMYMENSSALNNLTPSETLPTTVTSLPTTDLNECTKNPCQHGICVNQDGGYTCTCSHGWTGQNCQQDINECDTHPCHHGQCVNQDGGYMCSCSYGWSGQNCQEDINECYRNPCQHGRCENNGGGYNCICFNGWTGTNCQQSRPCQSGWSEYNNHCYKLFKDKVDWSTANGKCKHHGANLASVTSADENYFVARLISDENDLDDNPGATDCCSTKENYPVTQTTRSFDGQAPKGYIRHLVYFGLKLTGGRWEWTDGSPLSYTNWAPNEPGKNFMGKTGYCGNMYSKDDSNMWIRAEGKKGQWNDQVCSWELPYVCKTPK